MVGAIYVIGHGHAKLMWVITTDRPRRRLEVGRHAVKVHAKIEWLMQLRMQRMTVLLSSK